MLDAVLAAERARRPTPRDAEPSSGQIEALERPPAARRWTPGVWRLPGGEDYYRLRLRCTSGLDERPGVDRAAGGGDAALLGRADRLLKGLGLGGGASARGCGC